MTIYRRRNNFGHVWIKRIGRGFLSPAIITGHSLFFARSRAHMSMVIPSPRRRRISKIGPVSSVSAFSLNDKINVDLNITFYRLTKTPKRSSRAYFLRSGAGAAREWPRSCLLAIVRKIMNGPLLLPEIEIHVRSVLFRRDRNYYDVCNSQLFLRG